MEIIDSAEKLKQWAKSRNHIVIYGAGNTARVFLQIVKDTDGVMVDEIIVTSLQNNPSNMYGIKVNEVKYGDKNQFKSVLISATDEEFKREIFQRLQETGYRDMAIVSRGKKLKDFILDSTPKLMEQQLIAREEKTVCGNYMSEEVYIRNVESLANYPYIWRSKFVPFGKLKHVVPIAGKVLKYAFFSDNGLIERKLNSRIGEFFDQIENEKPIIVEDVYDIEAIEYISHILRDSNLYGFDNHLYLFYSSFEEFESFLAVLDWANILDRQNIVFLFGEDEKRKHYPLTYKGVIHNPLPLGINEINSVIYTNTWHHETGNVFLFMLLDSHPNLLTITPAGLAPFAALYESSLAGSTVDDAIENIYNPRSEKEKSIVYFSFLGTGKKLVNRGMPNRRIFSENLHRLLGNGIPTKNEWFRGIFLAYGYSFGRKFNQRIVPTIFYNEHNMPLEGFGWDEHRLHQGMKDVISSFKYRRAYMMVRDARICSGCDFENPFWSRDKEEKIKNLIQGIRQCFKSNVRYRDEFDDPIVVVRFEDFKLYPRKMLNKFIAYLKLPWSDTLLSTTAYGREQGEIYGASGFEITPVYRKHDSYLGSFDRFRLELLFGRDYEVWGYKWHYYDGVIYSLDEIRKIFDIPFKFEYAFKNYNENYERIHSAINSAINMVLNERGKGKNVADRKPVEWLKPDIPEGAKLYE